jgi:hypothetical protein
MLFDDDFTEEPKHEGEPVERVEGVLIEGSKHADLFGDDDFEIDLNPGAEPDLWAKQSALIEEDEKDGLKLGGFSDDEIPRILEAMGDDSAEIVSDAPGGTSATGADGEPEFGGFPERKSSAEDFSDAEDLVLEETKPGRGIEGFEGEEVGGG